MAMAWLEMPGAGGVQSSSALLLVLKMALPKPRFPSQPASGSALEVLGAKHPKPKRPPATCVCPWCQQTAKRVRAINEDGLPLVVASFDEEAGGGLDIDHDAPAAYQCESCSEFLFLTP